VSKIKDIFRFELTNTISRRSFIISLILVPLIPGILVGVLGLMDQGQRQSVQELFAPDLNDNLPKAYIDHSGLIQSLPDGFPQDALLAYDDETQAQADLEAGKLSGFYIVPADYVEKGEVTMVTLDANPATGFEQNALFNEVLRFNLLGSNMELYQQYTMPANFEYVDLAPEEETPDMNDPMAFYLPYGITMLFYILIMTSASLLLNNISKEKENRVMEILLASVKPIQMFTAKILALGVAGLLQLVVWLGAALLIMRLGGTTLNIPAGMQFSPSLLLWGIIFFVLGYGIYGSLMAGLGAMVPNLREASQSTFMIVIPMIIPLMFISELIQNPNGSVATLLSFVPLTASTAMMTRLAATSVPIWQPMLSALLQLGLVILIVRGVAKLFKAQTMLTGQKFTAQAFLKAIFGKA